MTDNGDRPRNLFDELRSVAAWRASEEARLRSEMGEIDDRVHGVLDQIGALEDEVTRLRVERFEGETRLAELDAEEARLARRALLAGMAADMVLMEERAARLRSLREALPALDELDQGVAEPETGDEYEIAPSVEASEATDDASTEAERLAIRVRSEAIRVHLRLAAREAFPRRERLSVIGSIEPTEGPPRVLVVILPVSFDTYLRWNSRGHDICATLAWRAVAHASAALAEVGAPDALFRYIPFEGQLAIQVWIAVGIDGRELQRAWERRFDLLCEEARELEAANIELHAAWVDPALVRPGARRRSEGLFGTAPTPESGDGHV